MFSKIFTILFFTVSLSLATATEYIWTVKEVHQPMDMTTTCDGNLIGRHTFLFFSESTPGVGYYFLNDTSPGKAALSMVLTAYSTGKKVKVKVDDAGTSSCNSNRKLYWLSIVD